ncbi:hypothetical protein LPZ50_23540, partial [Bordetella petrii]|nr:hypothetical protein [Bordetella petrii]
MQVGVGGQAGSELHAWRQFLSRNTLWLGVWLLGSAVICWVAANWPDLSKFQRFAVARGVMCEPPAGVPALEPVLAAAQALDVD